MTGIPQTGQGVLSTTDAEFLAPKVSLATNYLHKPEHPLRSLTALGTSHWLLADTLSKWERINEKDHQLMVDAFGVAQNNVSPALSCTQAQLRVQTTIAAITREGDEDTLPTEIQKVIWDNATQCEKDFQSCWYLVNFIYDPTNSKATAFVLTIHDASV